MDGLGGGGVGRGVARRVLETDSGVLSLGLRIAGGVLSPLSFSTSIFNGQYVDGWAVGGTRGRGGGGGGAVTGGRG